MLERVQHRIAKLSVRPHLPRRTIRLRLTVVYGGLFLISGAGLLAITYFLVRQATGGTLIFNGPNGISGAIREGTNGSTVRPQTQAHGIPGATAQKLQAQAHQFQGLALQQHANEMHKLLIYSGIALAIMAVLSIALGWFIGGRVLRPLRTITNVVHDISATNLHDRLALGGPNDELKKLGDTFDELLGRLAGAFDAQRHFVANASHELRTPLTLVRALLQMALTDPDATLDSFRSTCQEVMAAGEHQERLIEGLLVLARSERGLDHRVPLELSVVTDDVLLARHPEFERLRLQVEAVTHTAPIEGDARLAERLVANLVDNAVRHNFVGGRVEVATGSRAGRPFLSVANTGPMVPSNEIDRLFEPFQRLSGDSTGDGNGLGLGLSIVQAIATAHDATLTAQAKPEGGLNIEVTFPASNARNGHRKTAPVRDDVHATPSITDGLRARAS